MWVQASSRKAFWVNSQQQWQISQLPLARMGSNVPFLNQSLEIGDGIAFSLVKPTFKAKVIFTFPWNMLNKVRIQWRRNKGEICAEEAKSTQKLYYAC